MITPALRAIVEDLLLRYVYALDSKNMRAWLECFADDGSYLCQSRENHARGLPIGYMWDDGPARLKDRVKTIDEVWAGTAEDYQPRHLVQCIRLTNGADGLLDAVSNFVVFGTTHRGDSQVLATGEYLDRVRVSDERALLVSRKAILDQITATRYLVYPI